MTNSISVLPKQVMNKNTNMVISLKNTLENYIRCFGGNMKEGK